MKSNKHVEIPASDWIGAKIDFENNTIITKSGKVYKDVCIDREQLEKLLK